MTLEVSRLNEWIEGIQADMVKWRRYLHQHPELSFHEEKTSQFIYGTLESFGGLELSRPTKPSVVAKLKGNQPGRVLGIRADMDALPINEENNFELTNKNLLF